MTRYFFDVNAQDSTAYDYSGRMLRSQEEARSFAELIAMDLGLTQSADAKRVEVRDVKGAQLFVVNVGPPEAIIA